MSSMPLYPEHAAEERENVGRPAKRRNVQAPVRHVSHHIESGMTYPTIDADPPWHCSNTAARGVAEDHYDVMTMEEIPNVPDYGNPIERRLS